MDAIKSDDYLMLFYIGIVLVILIIFPDKDEHANRLPMNNICFLISVALTKSYIQLM